MWPVTHRADRVFSAPSRLRGSFPCFVRTNLAPASLETQRRRGGRPAADALRCGLWYNRSGARCLQLIDRRQWPTACLRSTAGLQRHARAAVEEIGYGQAKRLASEFLRRRHVDRFGGRVRIDGFRERGGCSHPGATITLRRTRLVPIESRDPRHDDFVALGLEHAIADAPADCHAGETENREQGTREDGPTKR